MKLSSKQIIETLTYSPLKDIERLSEVINKHNDICFGEDETRELVVNGVDGYIGDVIAYELGLNPRYKPKYKQPPMKIKSQLPMGIYPHGVDKYQVSISHKSVKYYLGIFSSLKCALDAWNKKAIEIGRKPQKLGKRRKPVGVYYHRKRKVYLAKITVNGTESRLGTFRNQKDAAIAYNKIAKPLGRPLNEVYI